MIRDWLIKHRWFNEFMKTMVAIFFGVCSYSAWGAGELASVEMNITQINNLMLFGVVAGIFGMLALGFLVDVVYSIVGIVQKKKKGDLTIHY